MRYRDLRPALAAWLDAIVLILLAVAVKAAVSDGLHLIIVRQAITIHVGDPWRPALGAVVLLIIRHWFWPRPHLLQRISEIPRAWRGEPRRFIVRVWGASRF